MLTTASKRSNRFTLDTVPTPAMVIDASTVRRNLRRLADYSQQHGIKLRPHTKTHKSRMLARLQLEQGAAGLTVAKCGEAESMADLTGDLLLAYPAIDPFRTAEIARLGGITTLRVAIDSLEGVDALGAAAHHAGTTIGILVDLDVGMHRTGVQSPHAALELAQHVDRTSEVRLDGLFCYPGHVWSAADRQCEPLAKVAALLQETLDLWSEHGLAAAIVSGGSTPTAYQSHLVPQLTEIRPGTYAFNDMNTVAGGYCGLEDCAARVVCTVVSTAVPNQVVLDAGTKTLAADRCIPTLESGHGYMVEYPRAKIVALSEEHGQVDISQCDKKPRLGERVTVIPNHICPCINLRDIIWWCDSPTSLEPWSVEARGKIV